MMDGFSTRLIFGAVAFIAVVCGPNHQAMSAEQKLKCFSIEFFYDSSVDSVDGLRAALEKFADNRTGLILHFRDVHGDETVEKRIDEIAKHFKLSTIKLPAIYGLKNVVADVKDESQLRARLNEILRMTAYVRNGCPHCRDAKAFLEKYRSQYPALEIVYKEVITDANANQEMQGVVRRYQQGASSLPVIHFCNGVSIGFDRESTTGATILQTLDYWSRNCQSQKKN